MSRGCALLLLLLGASAVVRGEAPQPAAFSRLEALEPAWRHVALPKVERANRYALIEDAGSRVLEVRSEASASTLADTIAVDPARTPVLSWRWKVSRALPGSDLASKAGDDYSARLYVFFDYDVSRLSLGERIAFSLARALHGDLLPAAALCYVWGTAQPPGTIASNPFTDRVRMIVLRSGDGEAGRWVGERRNIAADFAAAFGEEAPAVSGVAVGADSDNTGGDVTAYFGDLRFGADD